MTVKRLVAGCLCVGVVGGTLATSKRTDLSLLLNAGKKAQAKLTESLPATRQLTAPMSAFRAGDVLPVEERVRVRILTDQAMTGADVTVRRTAETQVQLAGVVQSSAQKQRAVDLANTTTGVETVVDELAVPAGK